MSEFRGRARRREYWFFTLYAVLISSVFFALLGLGMFFNIEGLAYAGYIFSFIYWMLLFCPTIAVLVRRLHDVGKSGLWFFFIFVPVVGPIWLLVQTLKDSQPGPNKWGKNIKGIGNDEE